jgi:hypothetical protein
MVSALREHEDYVRLMKCDAEFGSGETAVDYYNDSHVGYDSRPPAGPLPPLGEQQTDATRRVLRGWNVT